MGLIGGNSFGFSYARARDGISPEQLEQETVELIDQLITDGPTEDELRRAKAQFERHWLHELARVDSRADALGEYATLHGDPHLDQLSDCRDHRDRQRRCPGGHAAMVPTGAAGNPDLSAGAIMRDFLPRPEIAPAAVWTFPDTDPGSAQ